MESYQAKFGPYLFGLLISTAIIYVWGTWKKWPKEKMVYHLIPWVLSYSAYMILFIGNISWDARLKYSFYYLFPGLLIIAISLSIWYKWEWTTKTVSISAMVACPVINYILYGLLPLPIWVSLLLTLLIGLFATRYTRQYAEALAEVVEKRSKKSR